MVFRDYILMTATVSFCYYSDGVCSCDWGVLKTTAWTTIKCGADIYLASRINGNYSALVVH